MDRRTLTRLRTEYPGSSWAIWSDDFPEDGCIEEDGWMERRREPDRDEWC